MASPEEARGTAMMARVRSPLVAVAEREPHTPMLGVITLDALLDRMLAA